MYNKDRTMISCYGMFIRQFSYVDLISIRQLLKEGYVNNFDKDACFAMLPK